MPALMILYDTIHICMRVGHRLERAANMIIINFLLLLTIIDIHILTSLTYNSADLQACYLANIIIIHSPTG